MWQCWEVETSERCLGHGGRGLINGLSHVSEFSLSWDWIHCLKSRLLFITSSTYFLCFVLPLTLHPKVRQISSSFQRELMLRRKDATPLNGKQPLNLRHKQPETVLDRNRPECPQIAIWTTNGIHLPAINLNSQISKRKFTVLKYRIQL
jgi:hypothetical protein